MMVVGRLCKNSDYKKKKQPYEKGKTPFSIDDILSSTKQLKSDSLVNIHNEKTNETLPNFLAEISSQRLSDLYFNLMNQRSQEVYAKWLTDFYKVHAANNFQPFWLSTFNSQFSQSHLNGHADLLNFDVDSKFLGNAVFSKFNFSSNNLKQLAHCRLKLASGSPISTDNEAETRKERSQLQDDVSCSLYSKSPIKIFNDQTNLKKNVMTTDSPLSALEKLTCVTFKELEHKQNILHAIANGRQAKMKRRKCRTAFTAFQLSVLEQRFNCHKYLTPTDRDHLAQFLDLSAPQVITWFQNRRAKQKRDLEELKNDIKTVKTWNDMLSETSSCTNSKISDDESVEVDVERC